MYLVFTGDQYYPSGGVDDYVISCKEFEQAKTLVEQMQPDWAHIGFWDGKDLKAAAKYWFGKWEVFYGRGQDAL